MQVVPEWVDGFSDRVSIVSVRASVALLRALR